MNSVDDYKELCLNIECDVWMQIARRVGEHDEGLKGSLDLYST